MRECERGEGGVGRGPKAAAALRKNAAFSGFFLVSFRSLQQQRRDNTHRAEGACREARISRAGKAGGAERSGGWIRGGDAPESREKL